MNYHQFRKALHRFKIFSRTDIKKIFPTFDSRRLVEWQEKGYILKVINRWYIFADIPLEDNVLYWAANRIYQPSYISLETVLSFYSFIPESAFSITSVSTLKTNLFDTPLGTFSYRHVKPALFFGYQIVEWENFPIKLAEPEKAILDYLYLNPQLDQHADWKGLRLNQAVMNEIVDVQKLQEYLAIINNKALNKRAERFLNLMELC